MARGGPLWGGDSAENGFPLCKMLRLPGPQKLPLGRGGKNTQVRGKGKTGWGYSVIGRLACRYDKLTSPVCLSKAQ